MESSSLTAAEKTQSSDGPSLLQVSQLKVLAAEREIEVMESREDKLMLTRRGDFIQVGGRFPRLTRKDPRARLNEIKKLIQLLR